MSNIHEHRDIVRDYECDIQGIVNNANYQHYLEHARHQFLRSRNVSFAELHNRGIDCVVARIDMRFKVPLKDGLRYIFYQDIYRASDDKLCLKGKVEVVGIINGRLGDSEELNDILCKN